jgi:hypothetical protein
MLDAGFMKVEVEKSRETWKYYLNVKAWCRTAGISSEAFTFRATFII